MSHSASRYFKFTLTQELNRLHPLSSPVFDPLASRVMLAGQRVTGTGDVKVRYGDLLKAANSDWKVCVRGKGRAWRDHCQLTGPSPARFV